MITLIFGSDTTASRNYLSSLITTDTVRYAADNINIEEINQLLEGGGLFEESKTIIIENFFSKKNKNLKELIELFKNNPKSSLIIWQDKELSVTDKNTFKGAELKEFKLSKFLFNFLDQLAPSNKNNVINFHEALKSSELELVFFMLTRQLRILISVKNPSDDQIDEVKRMADWQQSKIKNQANKFSNQQLVLTFEKLSKIDSGVKTGESSLSLEQNIDILLANL